MTNQDQINKEIERENTFDSLAVSKKLEEINKSIIKGELEFDKARKFIAKAYSVVKFYIEELQNKKVHGHDKYIDWFKEVNSEVASTIALRVCVSNCLKNNSVSIQTLSSEIGREYEVEVLFKKAHRFDAAKTKRLYERLTNSRGGTNSAQFIRYSFKTLYKFIFNDFNMPMLKNADHIQIGKYGVQAMLASGLLKVNKTKGKKGIAVNYSLDDEVYNYLLDNREEDLLELNDYMSSAMIAPPQNYNNILDGGYYTDRRKKNNQLVNIRLFRDEVKSYFYTHFNSNEKEDLFNALNYIQSIPYVMNNDISNIIKDCFREGKSYLGIVCNEDKKPPRFPLSEDFDKNNATESELQVFKEWKRQMTDFYTQSKKFKSHVLETSGIIKAFNINKDQKLYFPIFLDKRGRIYYRGSPNLQGTDASKASLSYYNKKRIGKSGLEWLKIQVANCYGFDKKRLSERARWTEDNFDVIERALKAPRDNQEVFGSDSPLCMLLAAQELSNALQLDNPESYESNLIVANDASCSGLQHFSALLRDEIGGKYTNLFDSKGEEKEDIYSVVSKLALEDIKKDLLDPNFKDKDIAEHWIKYGIPRKLAKKPVMTYVYGATLFGTTEFIRNYCNNDFKEAFIYGFNSNKYYQYLAKKIFNGIAYSVPKATEFMNILKSVASNSHSFLSWETKTGFKVFQDYRAYDQKRIWLRSCGISVCVAREFNDKTSKIEMVNSISPNFVHSLDAAHMALVALECSKRNIALTGIHDSFGTHACDVEELRFIIKDQFVKMYNEYDVIESLEKLNNVKISDTIKRGSLDLNEVYNSEFFVS